MIGAFLGGFSPWAAATQFAYGFGYVTEYSSNIGRVAQDPVDEWINSVIGGFAYAEDTATVRARATAQVELRDYANDTFANETLGALDAAATWTLSPQRLTWTLEDAYRPVVLDPRVPETPATRFGSNVVSTGPDAFFRVARRHTLSLGARYGNVYVEDTALDNDRYTGSIRWLYQLGPVTTASLNAERLEVDFDDPVVNENFGRDDIYLRLEQRLGRSRFELNGGWTKIDRERSEDLSGSLARLIWSREPTSDSAFQLTLASGFEDVGVELLSFVTGAVPSATSGASGGFTSVVVVGNVYRSRRADVLYTRRGSHLVWSGRAVARELDFDGRLPNREEAGLRLEANYAYTGAVSFGLYGDYRTIDYADIGREDEDRNYGLRLGYMATRRLSLNLLAFRVDRKSTDPVNEFVDKRALLTILWSTGPFYTPRRR